MEHAFAHGEVILFGVSQVGEHLSKCLFVVDLHKVFVFRQCLFLCIDIINGCGVIVVIGLAMDDAAEGQTVGEGRILIGPAQSDRCYREDKAGQLEKIDNLFGLIHRRAKEAGTESFFFCKVAEGLRI